MLTLVLLLSILHFISPRLGVYRYDLEQFVSKIVQQPVQIGEISIGSRGLEPVFRFYNVVIFNNAKNKKILQARELQVGIDLIGSLLKWQIKPGLLLIRSSEFSVYQKKDGGLSLLGVSPTSTIALDTSFIDEISSWLFEQSRIDLEDITLNWNLVDGKAVKINNLYLRLHNGILQHDLKIGGNLEQKSSPAIFKADLKLRGDFLKNSIPPFAGDVVIDNWQPEFDLKFSGGGFFMPSSGNVNLLVRNSNVTTKFFRQSMPIKNIESKIVWQRDDIGWKVNISKLEFMDDWLTFYGDGQLLFPVKSQMPVVDIQLGLKLSNLAKAKLYYPITVLPHSATAWLDKAFISSKSIYGKMILQGPLDKFPFDNNEGRFLVDTNIRDVHLNYDPDWPHIENITGKMVFSNRSLTISANSAKILHAPVKSIKTTIPDLEMPILHVIAAIDTDSSVGLKFLNLSPLKNTVGRKLQAINLIGPMKFGLEMDMPLSDDVPKKDTDVEGDIELYNNNVHSNSWNFSINNLQGNLHFNNGNLVAKEIRGKAFNRPIKLAIHTLNPNTDNNITHVNILGNAEVGEFEQAFSVKLHPYVFGNFNYHALLQLHNSSSVQNMFKLNSDLVGVEVNLPEPFAKKAASAYKFNLIGYFGGNKLPQVTINYNDQINAALMIKKTDNNSLQVLAGDIKFGTGHASVSANSGLVISGNIAKLDWPVWKDYLTKAKANFATIGLVIRQISLNVAELNVLGQIFKHTVLKAQPKNSGWDVAFLTPNIDGKLFFPSDDKAVIQGVFKKLFISKEQQNLTTLKPQSLLPMHFKIDTLNYNGKNFNQVEFITEHQTNGVKINKITVSDSKFSVDASGDWVDVGNNQSSIFRGKINSDDVGGLLKQWELTDNVTGGKGSATFVLRWPNSPYKPTLQTVSGTFSIQVKDGRIIHLSKQAESKLGFGRILSLFSLQSLPQRLTLDFSDLTKKGFGFNTMSGDFELSGGNALVRKLTLDGPSALVKANGRIGLKTQDYDIMLSAAPKITSSIPIAAAIVGGPVVGVLSFIADRIVSTAIKKTTNYNYHITGRWDAPSVDKK